MFLPFDPAGKELAVIGNTTTDEFLAHHGVKGMKWGVRKAESSARLGRDSKIVESGKGWTVDDEGRVTISKGATISRVVRGTAGLFGGAGNDWQSGKPVYAAFKPVDINDYEHFFGRSKSLFTKEASTVVKLTPKSTLRAPGPKEATALYFQTAKENPEALKDLQGLLHGVAKFNLNKALDDPSTQTAYDVYSIALDAGNYSKSKTSLNKHYFDKLGKSGYNMLVDPSDAGTDFDAPIIVLDGKKSLDYKGQHIVDKVSQESARKLYNSHHAEEGKRYLQKLGYN
jgi:hypothetical protein